MRLLYALRRRGPAPQIQPRGRGCPPSQWLPKSPSTLRLTIHPGADANLPTADGHAMRPLHFSAQEGDLKSVRHLLAASADCAVANADGVTAVQLARNDACAQRGQSAVSVRPQRPPTAS